MSSESKDYSKEPVSLAEARAQKAKNASLWAPRDALIDVLRRIDAGEVNPEAILIVYRFKEGEDRFTEWTRSGDNEAVFIGMLEQAKIGILRPKDD